MNAPLPNSPNAKRQGERYSIFRNALLQRWVLEGMGRGHGTKVTSLHAGTMYPRDPLYIQRVSSPASLERGI
jgi:hypothetical protein